MKTSYFGNIRKLKDEKNVVSIARGNPKWFTGRIYYPLAPTWPMVKMKDMDQYTVLFNRMLDKLDAHKVVEELGEDAVLLCYEKPGDFCHRHLVAEWIERETGIKVGEFGQCPHHHQYEKDVPSISVDNAVGKATAATESRRIRQVEREPFVPMQHREIDGQTKLF